MLRHVVLLTLDPSAGDAARTHILDGLATLPAAIPEIVDYRVGVDAGLAEGNATIGIVAEFADRSAYVTYRDHPLHRQVIEERILPVLASRSAIQIEE